MASQFVHLHTHSHYSLLDGLTKIKQMVKIAKEADMPAIALTDHGNMYGAIDFYKECQKNDIKPIIGVEAYMTSGARADKTSSDPNGKRYYHLILLAKNKVGYKNLIRLVTIANLEGYYYKPRMDREILRLYHEGIICLSGCMGGELSQTLLRGNFEKADEIVKEYQEIFGKENYFIEIQSHPTVENDKRLRDLLVMLANKHGIPAVATQDSHYPCQDDHHAHHTLLQINTGSDGKEGMEFSKDDFSLINEKTAREYFKDVPEAVSNTMLVADLCEEYDLELGKAYFPHYEIESGKTGDQTLRDFAYEGFAFRNLPKTKEYTDRLDYELDIIKQKGYPEYFLVVADLLKFARESGIYYNTRGSAAGCLTSYMIGITSVDPIEYKLPFERFLNPERPSLPDIDMDYADNRRDEIIEYAKRKYGEDKVAQIGTFGTMMAKGAVRDVARALGYPYTTGDRLSKWIPMGSQGFPMTIDHAMELVPELAEAYKNEKDTKEIIDLAKKLEGCVRHVSVHAAGVVIAPTPLYDYTPVQLDPKGGAIITQYDMHAVEDAGLPKFDFLGIRNLAILADAVRLVKITRDIDVDLDKVPIEDPRTFELLAKGETEGLFQLNGSGMTRYLKELRPTSIHDINAMVALYRPGPMESIPEYIARKRDNSLIKYLDPRMKDILDQSYGVITYQDDVMMISIKLAGYSWLEADKLRKAMGKKIPAEMEAQKEKLLSGFEKNGLTPKKAMQLWKLIEPFAAYGFNKAHAASYGRVAYQTGYMKANFPVEYMSAILTAESGDVEKIAEIIAECKKMNIEVLPPSVNESFGGFTVIDHVITPEKKGVIRFGLYTIKNLGTDISNAIIEERKNKGPFTSIGDFLDRVTHKNVNKKSLEALIKSGAMDELADRGTLYGNIESMLEYNKEAKKVSSDQTSLFGGMPIASSSFKIRDTLPISQEEKLMWEKELLGLYISGHPLDKIRDKLENMPMNIKKVHEAELPVPKEGEKRNRDDGLTVTIAGIIETVRIVMTKKNERMAFVKIADLTGSIEAVVFPKLFATTQTIFVPDVCIVLVGKVTLRNDEKSIVIERVKKI